MTQSSRLSFIVADDHPLVRQGVRMVLESAMAETRVAEAANLDATLAAVVTQPDAILLIDLDMPGMNGVESLRALRQDFPRLLMAVLSANADPAVIASALGTGVNGYILKALPPEELLRAVATIRDGQVYVPEAISRFSGTVPAGLPAGGCNVAGAEPQRGLPPLTPRQRGVIAWLKKGHSNKQIARHLNIGEGTVKIHLASIFRALEAQNRTEAVVIANRLGL